MRHWRELESIQREMGAAQQIQLLTHQQDVAENRLYLIFHRRDKMGDGAVVGLKTAAQGHEDDILTAGPLNGTRNDHAA